MPLTYSAKAVEDTTLNTAGTALISAGVALLTSATEQNQMISGGFMVLMGIACFAIKYFGRENPAAG